MANEFLAIGHPRFTDPHLTELAASDGAIAAWRRVISASDKLQATNAVHGDFAVGVRLPCGGTFLAVDRFAIRTLC